MTNTATQEKVRLYRMSTPEHECPWGLKAVDLLTEKGIEFEDHKLKSKAETEAFKAKHNVLIILQSQSSQRDAALAWIGFYRSHFW